jgi:hypothetical protein
MRCLARRLRFFLRRIFSMRLPDREDAEFLGGTTGLEFDAVADFLADQFPAQRRFGGDDADFLAADVNFGPTAFRSEKIEGADATR